MLAESNLVMVHYSNAYFAARAFVLNNPGAATMFVFGIILLLLGIIGVMQLRKMKVMIAQLGNTRPMTTAQEHERKVMDEVSYAITSGIEDAVADGRLTRSDARRWYRRLGNIFDMKGLLPKGQATLKEEIKERLAQLRLSKVVIIMPGDKPATKTTSASGTADNVVELEPRKRLGSKLSGKAASL